MSGISVISKILYAAERGEFAFMRGHMHTNLLLFCVRRHGVKKAEQTFFTSEFSFVEHYSAGHDIDHAVVPVAYAAGIHDIEPVVIASNTRVSMAV